MGVGRGGDYLGVGSSRHKKKIAFIISLFWLVGFFFFRSGVENYVAFFFLFGYGYGVQFQVA